MNFQVLLPVWHALANLNQRNTRIGLMLLGLVALMVGLAFASAPLYSLFCRVTGFNGTPRIGMQATAKQVTPSTRMMRVRFNTDVNIDMPWQFRADTPALNVQLGQDALISFTATNPTRETITGTAIYNVLPEQAAKYFNKTQCFCFDRQVLKPGESAHFPVAFYIDPAILSDPDVKDLEQITLSYTFFKADSKALDNAISRLERK